MAPTGKTQRANKAAKTSAGQSQQMDDSPAPSPGSVSESVPLISPGSPASQDGDSTDLDPLADADIRRHIMSLPTKADLERFADRVEKAFKEDIAQLKADTNHLGGRLDSLEQKLEETLPVISKLQDKCNIQGQQIEALLCQLDDTENRSRRANIRIRGLPEATGPRDIIPTLEGIFKEILGLPATATIEIDRAHRALKPPSQDANNPRDIICKLHKYTLKDRIMQKMRGKPYFDFDGAHLAFYQDISRRTLMQRRALRPLLTAIQDAGLVYRWGFPFSLQVTKDGRTITLRNKDDLPHFLTSLDLDPVDFPDWRCSSDLGNDKLPTHQPWQPARNQNRKRNRRRHLSESSLGMSLPGN